MVGPGDPGTDSRKDTESALKHVWWQPRIVPEPQNGSFRVGAIHRVRDQLGKPLLIALDAVAVLQRSRLDKQRGRRLHCELLPCSVSIQIDAGENLLVLGPASHEANRLRREGI